MMTRQERERLMTEALWQAFYHGELDELARCVLTCGIDGNDHPALRKAGRQLAQRLQGCSLTDQQCYILHNNQKVTLGSQVGPSTITVRELMGLLDDVPEDKRDEPVLFACDYGDYHHTTQVLGISELSDEPKPIQEEAYSQSRWGLAKEADIDEDEDNDEGPDEDETVEGPSAFILS